MKKTLSLLLFMIFVNFINFVDFVDFSYAQNLQSKNQTQTKINVVYLSGDVKIDNSIAKLHQQVFINQKIQTGSDGHIYLKSSDNGFLVLRPNSTAFIRAYAVDVKNPQNNRIKIELENGVARHISGEAVKTNKQNFRFNTPVAAIGVRGTDFVVFTDNNASRIAVNSGGIAISPFNQTCLAEAFGACQGDSVRELFAKADKQNTESAISQILEVSVNEKFPKLLENISDTRLHINEEENQNIENSIIQSQGNENQENLTSVKNVESIESIENAEKNNQNLVENSQNSQNTEQTNQTNQTNNENPENSENPDKIVADDNENLTPEKIENVEVIPASDINWGRWKEITDKPIQIDLQNLDPQSIDFLAKNDYFAVFRNKGEWQRPLNNLQFALINSEAVLSEINGNISDAYVRAGGLNIDIANQRFDTNLSVEYKLSDQQKTKIQDFKAVGNLSNQGTFDSLAGFSGSTMSVNGALSHDNNEAAYIFQGRTFSNSASPNNQILGVTQWGIRK